MAIIFENKEEVKKSDIPIQILRAVLFLLLLFLVSKIRFINNEISSMVTIFFGIGITVLFVYLILNSKTVKKILIEEGSDKLTFILSRQMRNDEIKQLKIQDLKINYYKTQTRATGKKVLLISDKNKSVKLNTIQKGITEKELETIMEELKALHTTTVNRQ